MLSVKATSGNARFLTDGGYQLDSAFRAGTTITLTADEEIASLYILFGSYPGEWTLRSGGAEQLCGTKGFLHEYVALDVPSSELEIVLPDHSVVIGEFFAYSAGRPPRIPIAAR